MLLARKDAWMAIHRCLCFVIEQMAMLTRYGTAVSFSSKELVQFLGCEKPTRAEVALPMNNLTLANYFAAPGESKSAKSVTRDGSLELGLS